jgi:hypothetical protein
LFLFCLEVGGGDDWLTNKGAKAFLYARRPPAAGCAKYSLAAIDRRGGATAPALAAATAAAAAGMKQRAEEKRNTFCSQGLLSYM